MCTHYLYVMCTHYLACVICNIFFTGVLSVASRIDFEKIEQTSFRALVYDTGVPRLSATTVVYVTVRNINDNSPIYTQVNCSNYKVGKLYPCKIYLHQNKNVYNNNSKSVKLEVKEESHVGKSFQQLMFIKYISSTMYNCTTDSISL